jgi:hypothetical protein
MKESRRESEEVDPFLSGSGSNLEHALGPRGSSELNPYGPNKFRPTQSKLLSPARVRWELSLAEGERLLLAWLEFGKGPLFLRRKKAVLHRRRRG